MLNYKEGNVTKQKCVIIYSLNFPYAQYLNIPFNVGGEVYMLLSDRLHSCSSQTGLT